MDNKTTPRRMFPESRFILAIFSPVLALFFVVCVYVIHNWDAPGLAEQIGKFVVEDVLCTFLLLCGVGFLAALLGPARIQPMIRSVGGKAARAALALILGTVLYVSYCLLTS